jgi:hypothetical protein
MNIVDDVDDFICNTFVLHGKFVVQYTCNTVTLKTVTKRYNIEHKER